jgi:hypothetical protein
MNSYRGGKGFVKSTGSFFGSNGLKDEKNARKAANAEALAGKGIRKRAVDAEKEIPGSGKMTAMREITKNNIPNFDAQGNKISGLDAKQLGQVK